MALAGQTRLDSTRSNFRSETRFHSNFGNHYPLCSRTTRCKWFGNIMWRNRCLLLEFCRITTPSEDRGRFIWCKGTRNRSQPRATKKPSRSFKRGTYWTSRLVSNHLSTSPGGIQTIDYRRYECILSLCNVERVVPRSMNDRCSTGRWCAKPTREITWAENYGVIRAIAWWIYHNMIIPRGGRIRCDATRLTYA